MVPTCPPISIFHDFLTLRTSIFAIPYSVFQGFSIFQQIASKMLPEVKKYPQCDSKRPPRVSPETSKRPQERSKRLQELSSRPQEHPKIAKIAPSGPSQRPTRLTRRPKTPPRAPKRLYRFQETSKRLPRGLQQDQYQLNRWSSELWGPLGPRASSVTHECITIQAGI